MRFRGLEDQSPKRSVSVTDLYRGTCMRCIYMSVYEVTTETVGHFDSLTFDSKMNNDWTVIPQERQRSWWGGGATHKSHANGLSTGSKT